MSARIFFFEPFLNAGAKAAEGGLGQALGSLLRPQRREQAAAHAPQDPREVERFRRLLLPHMDAAYAFARYLSRDPAVAEDLVQDAYLKAYRGFSGYRGGDPRAWLFAILRTGFISWTRTQRAWGPMAGPDDDEVESIADPGATPEEALAHAGDVDALRRAVEGLPDPFRETLVLRELQEMSYRQIADITGAPVGTVMSRLARARGLLAAAHLATCAGCSARWRTLQALREHLSSADLNPPAPAHLYKRIDAMIAAESRPKPKASPAPANRWRTRFGAGWAAAGALAGVAASLLAIQLQPASASLEGQLVDSHVRSLLANHLIDVATSDRHVVKPWFNGKIDFAPPVVDLADLGFPLVGGRLDYADNRVVAALVYRRKAHVINLFVLPATFGSDWRHAKPSSYSVVHWRRGSLDYWAVSDVEAGDLKQFQQDFEARTGS